MPGFSIGPQAGASQIIGSASLPASPTFRQIYCTPSGLYVCLSNGSWTLLDVNDGDGTVTSVSVVTANGFSGSVANASTTPAITINNPTALVATTSVTTPQIILGTASSVTGALKLANASSANLTTIQAGNAAAARTYTWPTNFGASGAVLTDAAGNGTLSWAVPASGVTIGTTPVSGGTAGRLLFEGAGNVVSEDADLSFATDTLTATKLSTTLVKSGDGTVGAPSFAFTSAPDMGMWATSTSILGFSVGGVRQFDIRANGAIFIPTDDAVLHFGVSADTRLSRASAGTFQIGSSASDASGSLKLTNLTTTATASTGTAAIIDASNVLRPQTSSLRFKDNVRAWRPSESQMNAFLNINPIEYDYKDGGAKKVLGFAAESLAAVDPELVNYDNEGKPYSNRDAAMVSYLFEIVKKQQKEIDSLRAIISGRQRHARRSN